MLHDPAEKKKRGYTCKHSIVYIGGREWLEGVDWKRRKAQLEARAEGRCEIMMPNQKRYQFDGEHPHHILKRSTSHDDRLENLLLVCGMHHAELHPEKNKLHWSKKP